MTREAPVLAATLSILLAGCAGDPASFVPGAGFEPTGRTIHLKAWVEDLEAQEMYPGFKANLWAFCFEAMDPTDAASVAAVEHREPLPGDAPMLPEGLRGKCSVPGPTLRVRQGDHVIVEFSNAHFHPHTIHWHGQLVPNEADGVPGQTQDTVARGGEYRYEFVAKRAGTLWYHCHVDTQWHMMQGLYGMMVVEPQDDTWEPEGVAREYGIVLSTVRREGIEALPGKGPHDDHPEGCASGFAGCENPPAVVEPDVFLVNGHSYPLTEQDPASRIEVREGERVRIRFLNAGATVEVMHLHGHDMRVTHKDGNPLDQDPPLWVDTLAIGPGERYDVVVEANNPGAWLYHTHVDGHETNCGKSLGGMHGVFVYEGHGGQAHGYRGELPATCPRVEPRTLPTDYSDLESIALDAEPQADVTWTFPVAQACTVRSIRFEAALGGGLVASAATLLDVTVHHPDGAVAQRFRLGGPDGPHGGGWTAEGKALRLVRDGDYEVRIQGRAADASLLLSVAVAYATTQAEADALCAAHAGDGHGGH